MVPLLLQTFHVFVRLTSPVLSPLCFRHAPMPHGRLCSVFIALAVYREMDALRLRATANVSNFRETSAPLVPTCGDFELHVDKTADHLI